MNTGIDIKICGLANTGDALAAHELGADYLGFVLYPDSPRAVTATELRRILDALPADVRAVGVFVNESPQAVQSVAQDCGLCAVQIHGDEPAEPFADSDLPLWRAVQCDSDGCRPDPADWPARRYVLDAAPRGQYGGSGVAGNWDAAAAFAAAHPAMLAGGLHPENIGDAVRRVRPLGVDVSSGVETEPGRKDHEQMRAFIAAARQAATE